MAVPSQAGDWAEPVLPTGNGKYAGGQAPDNGLSLLLFPGASLPT